MSRWTERGWSPRSGIRARLELRNERPSALSPCPQARGAPIGDRSAMASSCYRMGPSGGRLNHRGTAIRLAEAGYIVAAPEHAGDSWRDKRRFSGTAENWRRRPRQLSAVLDRLLGDTELGPHIDAGTHRSRRALGRRLQRARADRRAGRHGRARAPTAPSIANEDPRSSAAMAGRAAAHGRPDAGPLRPARRCGRGRRAGRRALRRRGLLRRYGAGSSTSASRS